MICFFFIPVHWLFFAASTYVWVQYVWHTGTWKTNFVRVVRMNNGVMYISIKIYDFSYRYTIHDVFVEATRLLVGILIVNGY